MKLTQSKQKSTKSFNIRNWLLSLRQIIGLTGYSTLRNSLKFNQKSKTDVQGYKRSTKNINNMHSNKRE